MMRNLSGMMNFGRHPSLHSFLPMILQMMDVAPLILDEAFGVSELLGVSPTNAAEPFSDVRCQQHPVLADLPNVLQGVG